MKRLERLGSIAFLTTTISLVFHLIGMSFNVWMENICLNCDQNNPLAVWHTSLRNRCYLTPVASIFSSTSSNSSRNQFYTEICLPNQFLSAKDPNSAYYCLLAAINQTHTICSVGNYDRNSCQCE